MSEKPAVALDILAERIEGLRALLEAHKELDNLRHAEEQKQLAAAETNLDRRLDTMNQFREQLTAERGHYVNRELHDKLEAILYAKIDKAEHDLVDKLDDAKSDLGDRLKLQELFAANIQGRMLTISGTIVLIGAVIQIALYWFHFH